MALNCGIVGLPNVGKSTIFKALTAAPAEAENYPFCTIEPNVGIVNVSDPRLDKLTEFVQPKKTVPAVVEFVDIAGLVKGASKGEGLGNQFLGHIRQVNAIAHVVRCFDDADVVHVDGKIDPASDIETIDLELALADLDSVQKKLANLPKLIKSQDKKISSAAKMQIPVLEKVASHLEEGKAARTLNLSEDDLELIADIHLLTIKNVIYVCNVDEEGLDTDSEHFLKVKNFAEREGASVVKICGKIEAEISLLEDPVEKAEFLESLGLEESGLEKLTSAVYTLLGLKTYFTAGEKEVRAWTFKKGARAPQAAGVIHTDFEKGFIKAEVYHCSDLFDLGSEQKVKEAGKMRLEGKEYVVNDGDVMHFRFNV